METESRTRAAIALTHRTIEGLQPSEAAYRIPDSRCRGLALRVAPSGKKTWDLSFRVKGGGYRRISLGAFEDVSLESARHRANELSHAARLGDDLIGQEAAKRTAESRRMNVGDFIELYARRRLDGRVRTAHEIKLRLKRALASLADQPMEEVTKRQLRELLDATADRGVRREAEQRRIVFRTMFAWAFNQDYIPADPSLGLSTFGPGPLRNRILDRGEIATLWRWLNEEHLLPDHSDVLRLQLCIGARCGEVAGMRAEEFDRRQWLWTLPGERSKNGKPRVTPILGIAREILAPRLGRQITGPLFLSERRMGLRSANLATTLVKRRHEFPIEHFTTHDLRRTVATMMVDLDVPIEIVGAIVGHQSTSGEVKTLVRHYVRTDFLPQKAAALSRWDQELTSILAGDEARSVHPADSGKIILYGE